MTDLETEAEQLREIQRLNAHINKQDAEIERLFAAREMMQLDAEKYRDEAKTLLAEIKQLRGHKEEADRHIATIAQLRAEIDRLLAAIQRIDGINDNPAVFNSEINAVCDTILRPELEPHS